MFTRRTATVIMSAPEASCALAITDGEAYLPVPTINREANVAGLTISAQFSAFVSNDGTNGVVGGAIAGADAASLGVAGAHVETAIHAAAAVILIAAAVGTLGTAQGNVGALENRLQFAVGLAQSQSVNTQAADSRIRDANIAEESAAMTKFNILTQSGIAALSQANQSSQAVLSLLK